jgi:hypothetical protein
LFNSFFQAYLNHRAERIRGMRWQFGAVLPPDVKANLCEAEQNFFAKYNRDLVRISVPIGIPKMAGLSLGT